MRFDEFAARAGKAVVVSARRVQRTEFGRLRAARRRRTALTVTSASFVGTLLVFGVVLFWPGSDAPIQPAVPASTSTTPSTSSTLAEDAAIPAECGDSLPLLATFTPGGSGELDPDGTPGAGPDSLPVGENQLVAHWEGEFGVVIEMRWPATSYLDEPDTPESDIGGLPTRVAPWSSTDDNQRVVAHIRLSEDPDDPCSLLSVDGYGPQIDPVYDQVLAFAEGLVDEERYAEYLAAIAEEEERRSRAVFCDQPFVDTDQGEISVTLYQLCDPGVDTGDRVLSGLQPVDRAIEATDMPLRAALEALVAGPTEEEITAGFASWFSPATDDAVLSVSIENGLAVIDLDAEPIESLNNVSTSTGGSYFRGQLYGTVFAFDTVTSVEFRLDGERFRFCSLMEMASDCTPITREEWNQIYTATFDN